MMKKLFLSCILFIGACLNAAAQPTLLDTKVLGFIEPQEFKRGMHTTLIEIPTLDQSKEAVKQGSSPYSSAYHALRNGITLIHALIEPRKSIDSLCKLYDKQDMSQKLCFTSPWRTLIRTHRKSGNFTDKLSLEELEALLDEEQRNGALADKGIPFAYFEYANPDEPHEKQFEAYSVNDNLKAIKTKLDANEDFTALIVVYTSTHKANDPLLELSSMECSVCMSEEDNNKATKKTPCCGQMVVCNSCWEKIVTDNGEYCTHRCPLCNAQYPGNLSKELKKLAYNKPLEGHFASLVLAKKGTQKHYFLLDSAAVHSGFVKNKPIRRLLEYLEGTHTPSILLPRYIPDVPSTQEHARLKTTFESYKASYEKKVSLLEKKQPFFQPKSFVIGILSIIGLYGCYYYYQKQVQAHQKTSESKPVS